MAINTSVLDSRINAALKVRKKRADAGLTNEERATRREEKMKWLEAEKVRKAEKKANVQQRKISKKPAHMAKIVKAEANLPTLSSDLLDALYGNILQHNDNDINNAIVHLQHHLRKNAVTRAISNDVALLPGDAVKVISGNRKLVGKEATIVEVKRIHAYINVDGKKHYVYTSELEKSVA